MGRKPVHVCEDCGYESERSPFPLTARSRLPHCPECGLIHGEYPSHLPNTHPARRSGT